MPSYKIIVNGGLSGLNGSNFAEGEVVELEVSHAESLPPGTVEAVVAKPEVVEVPGSVDLTTKKPSKK